MLLLSALAALAFQPSLADLKLDNRHVENFIVSQLEMSGGNQYSSPAIPKVAVDLYKAMNEQAKVAAVKQVLGVAKSMVMTGTLLASRDNSIARQYGGKDYGIKVPTMAEIKKMPAAAQNTAQQRMRMASTVHDVYRQEFVDSLRRGVEGDLRGAKYQAQSMPTMKPDPKEKVKLLEAALAVPVKNEAEFRRKVAEARLFAADDHGGQRRPAGLHESRHGAGPRRSKVPLPFGQRADGCCCRFCQGMARGTAVENAAECGDL